MMHAAHKYYPETTVRYELIACSDEDLSEPAQQVEDEIGKPASCQFSEQELSYLSDQAPYLEQNFIDYLASFRFKPAEQVTVSVTTQQNKTSLKSQSPVSGTKPSSMKPDNEHYLGTA